MTENLQNILGRRKPTNHSDLKGKTRTPGSASATNNQTSGKRSGPDGTDFTPRNPADHKVKKAEQQVKQNPGQNDNLGMSSSTETVQPVTRGVGGMQLSSPGPVNDTQNSSSDFKSVLEDLEAASKLGFDNLRQASIESKLLPVKVNKSIASFSNIIDQYSQQLIPRSKLGGEYAALQTTGDGNCLFRAASILACGDEERHLEMRVRTVVELACHSSFYLNYPTVEPRIRAQEQLRFKSSNKGINKGEVDRKDIEDEFKADVVNTCKPLEWASCWHLQALATVLDRRVQSVFPECGEEVQEHLNVVFEPRDSDSEMKEPLVIMWTRTGHGSWETPGKFEPNHFVPLVPAYKARLLEKEHGPPHNIGMTAGPSSRVKEERRPSLPSNFRDEKPKKLQHNYSDPSLSQNRNGKELTLGDPLAISVLNNLALLEGLASYLDKENPYGNRKYWKHVAEHFGIEAKTYEAFTCSQESPTEKLFDFLIARDSEEFTIERIKRGLYSINRGEVISDVLIKCQQLHSELTDETPVERLSETRPGVFREITLLLDVDKPGTNNWKQLADELGVSRSESFAESIQDDPTGTMLEHLIATRNSLTVGHIHRVLKNLDMKGASDVITKSTEVTENTPLEDFFDKDLDAVVKLCNFLNQRHNNIIRRWRLLGNKLKIEKDVLDTFAPHEDEIISPTHALINHLSTRPALTMADLIWALDSIGREDALRVVNTYFPVGLVHMYLENRRQTSGKQSSETASFTYGETEI